MYVTCIGNVDSNVQDWVSKNIVGRVKMLTSGCQYHINHNPTHVDYDSERDSRGCVVTATLDGCCIEFNSLQEFKNFISNGFLKVSCDAYKGIVLSVKK